MKTIQQVTGWFFTIVFLLFAYWQNNDPDPIIWIPPYLISAYIAFRTSQDKINPEVLILASIMSFAAGLQMWTEMDAWEGFITDGLSMKTHNQELAREAVGLWITTFSFVVQLIIHQTKKN